MSYDLSIIVAMVIAVGSSTSTASRSTSTALLSTIRTTRLKPSGVSSFLALYYGVRKTQTARVPPPHLLVASPPLGVEGELRKVVLCSKHNTNWFAVFFASSREPLAQATA
jgi:hypothetical protein